MHNKTQQQYVDVAYILIISSSIKSINQNDAYEKWPENQLQIA